MHRNMGFHACREPVIDGAHLHIHALQRAERPLNEREALVGDSDLVGWKAGSHNVGTVEARLG